MEMTLFPCDAIDSLPVVISIDCEPDLRVTPSAGPSPWDGLEGVIEMIATWREQVPGGRIGWYWRADEQVAHGHGDPGWALRAYRGHIDATTALGDEHGLHPHLWRWSDRKNTWVSDAADEDWAERCVQDSIDTFMEVLDRPVRAMRMGDGHMSPRILATMERAGVRCDLTLEPGAAATPSLAPSECTTGMIPDRRATPHRPFRPSRLDPCRPAATQEPGHLWALPLTTATTGLTGIAPGTPANLGFPPERFRRIVVSGLAESVSQGAPYIAVVARSDVGQDLNLTRCTVENLAWLTSGGAGIAPPRFLRPLEVLQVLGSIRQEEQPSPS
jgi:hypothetical protein